MGSLLKGLEDHGFGGHSAPERAGWRVLGRGPNLLGGGCRSQPEHRIATMPELQYIRLDLHAFNTEEDVDRILDCFAGLYMAEPVGIQPV